MRNEHLRMLRRVFFGVVTSTVMLPAWAQVSDPTTWKEFVKGTGNTLAADTFMRQSFHGRSTDNWNYTTAGGAHIPEGKITVVIPPGGSIAFDEFPTEGYDSVTISFLLAADKLEVGENLSIEYLHDGNIHTEVYHEAQKDDEWFQYREKLLRGNSLKMAVSTASVDTLGGYYLASCFKAFGMLPRYSLFTGSGSWTDNTRWSNLAPYRSRRALVGGDAEVSSPVQCNGINLSHGSLKITQEGILETDSLCLHGTDFSITTAGSFSVNKSLSIHHTFPEKGTWYFLAFPFDVRLSGIDSRFSLEDDEFTGSGNHIYVQTYDGDRRSALKTASGNWAIVSPPDDSSSDPLVFERGKGYLVAIDAAATDNTLTFSSSDGDIPSNFGASASIPLRVSSSADGSNDGWCFCGNPLPATLHFSQISPNTALDGYVYLYDNGTYTAYDIKGDYEIPPLSTFFVKARRETSLVVGNAPATRAAKLLSVENGFSAGVAEPIYVADSIPTAPDKGVSCVLRGNELCVKGLPAGGRLQTVDAYGHAVYSCLLPQGESVHSLPLKGGFYVLVIEAGTFCVRQKCFLPL